LDGMPGVHLSVTRGIRCRTRPHELLPANHKPSFSRLILTVRKELYNGTIKFISVEQTDLTVARKCRVMKSYIFHSVSLRESLVALHIGVIGGWSPASVPELLFDRM
jgi:hypothetical protein